MLIVRNLIESIKRFFVPKSKQTTFVYCPTCRNELTGERSSYVYDENYHVLYKCFDCGTFSLWDFDAPVPLLLEQDLHGV